MMVDAEPYTCAFIKRSTFLSLNNKKILSYQRFLNDKYREVITRSGAQCAVESIEYY